MTKLDDRDADLIARMRTAYHAIPADYGLERRSRLRGLPILLAAAAVTLVAAVPVIVHAGNASAPSPSASQGGEASSGPNLAPENAVDSDLTEALFRALDSADGMPAYALAVDPGTKTVNLWLQGEAAGLTASLSDIARSRGFDLETLPYPTADPRTTEKLDAVAERIRNIVRANPEYGFTTLHLSSPTDEVVVWRTHEDHDLDRAVTAAGAKDGVQVVVLEAPTSASETEVLADDLRSRNADWEGRGFRVEGAYPTGSGPVVLVTGDLAAARVAITDSAVLTVLKDDVVTPNLVVTKDEME
jgi:hypothetical protein